MKHVEPEELSDHALLVRILDHGEEILRRLATLTLGVGNMSQKAQEILAGEHTLDEKIVKLTQLATAAVDENAHDKADAETARAALTVVQGQLAEANAKLAEGVTDEEKAEIVSLIAGHVASIDGVLATLAPVAAPTEADRLRILDDPIRRKGFAPIEPRAGVDVNFPAHEDGAPLAEIDLNEMFEAYQGPNGPEPGATIETPLSFRVVSGNLVEIVDGHIARQRIDGPLGSAALSLSEGPTVVEASDASGATATAGFYGGPM